MPAVRKALSLPAVWRGAAGMPAGPVTAAGEEMGS
jgi:hypothetical protein